MVFRMKWQFICKFNILGNCLVDNKWVEIVYTYQKIHALHRLMSVLKSGPRAKKKNIEIVHFFIFTERLYVSHQWKHIQNKSRNDNGSLEQSKYNMYRFNNTLWRLSEPISLYSHHKNKKILLRSCSFPEI